MSTRLRLAWCMLGTYYVTSLVSRYQEPPRREDSWESNHVGYLSID